MKKYARIEAGTVREIIRHANAFDMSKAYHPSLVWVEITSITPVPQEGWLYDEGTGSFTEPPPPPAPPSDAEVAEQQITGSMALTGLMRELAVRFGVTEQDIITAIKGRL